MPNGLTVLIVEDNAEMRLDLSDLFELEGYTVHTAATGIEALAVFQRTPVDAVISDYQMPEMDGEALFRRLRANPRMVSLPFILVSGVTPPPLPSDPLFSFIRKPFTIEELLRTATQLILLRRRLEYYAAD